MGWTLEEEEESNKMRYGVCPECGTPRAKHIFNDTYPDGRRVVNICFVAPCEHGLEVAKRMREIEGAVA